MERSRHCRPDVTLENCAAIRFELQSEPGKPLTALIVWRDGPKVTRPERLDQRIRDVQAGDWLLHHGVRKLVTHVEIWR